METTEVAQIAQRDSTAEPGTGKRLKIPTLPIFLDPNLEALWVGFNRAFIVFLDNDIAVKLQLQYRVSEITLPQESFLLELSVVNFLSSDKENATLGVLSTDRHPNLVRKLDSKADGILFFERIEPLTMVWKGASQVRRRRWATELVSALAHLEKMGFVPNKTQTADLGVDRTGRLKLVGFGTMYSHSTRAELQEFEELDEDDGCHPNERYRRIIQDTHQRLASCLHYILTGNDPFSQDGAPKSKQHLDDVEKMMNRGQYPVEAEATCIATYLQAAWGLKCGTKTFAEVADEVTQALKGSEGQEEKLPSALSEDHYKTLSSRCNEWLAKQQPDPMWIKGRQQYLDVCEEAGYQF